MGSVISSNIPPGTPLGCLLENLKSLKLTPDLKASKLIYLCNKVWIQYQLHNSSKWPLNGTLDPIILRDLNTHCQWSGKWKEASYIQALIYLHSNPSICSSSSSTQLLLAMKPAQSPQDDTTTLDPDNELPPFCCRPVSLQPWFSQPEFRKSPGGAHTSSFFFSPSDRRLAVTRSQANW